MDNQIFQDVIESIQDYLPKLIKVSNDISTFLRINRDIEALALIPPFAEGIEWISDALNSLEKNGYVCDMNDGSFNEFLYEINKGLELSDHVLVADVFEYEMVPALEKLLQTTFKRIM